MLSIIVPVLNEAEGLPGHLAALAPLRRRGCEVIVVDGGSDDASADLARPLADAVVAAPRGRAPQMNAGAAAARGEWLLFLHADTRLPENADGLIAQALDGGKAWGCFDVAIEGPPGLALVARLMNWRCRLTGIATGDQAIFVTRSAFDAVGRYPDIALMEDIAISKGLKRLGRPACLRERAVTSGRRWQRHGPVRTVLLMWRLRAAYALGADPDRLARRYGYRSRRG